MAVKNTGDDAPSSANSDATKSTVPLRLTAATIPSGMAISSEMAKL
jgi:hypothetical protein